MKLRDWLREWNGTSGMKNEHPYVRYYETLADVCTEMGVGIDRGIAWSRAGLIHSREQDGRWYVSTHEADRMVSLGPAHFDGGAA